MAYPLDGLFAFGAPGSTAQSMEDDVGFGGGTVAGLAVARTESWRVTLDFLARALSTGDGE